LNKSTMSKRGEAPKRLAPTRDVLRELYLRSGNECAFPGCIARLLDSDGKFIGQLCHIEGVGPTSARFNPKQTNEQRRARSNLLFMCYPHHIETDDVSIYTVERMKQLKRDHESRFSDVAGAIRASIVDRTSQDRVVKAQSLVKMGASDWQLTPTQMTETLAELHEFAVRLARLPVSLRELMAIIARRAKRSAGINMGVELAVHELRQVTGLKDTELLGDLEMLTRNGFIQDGFPNEVGQSTVEVRNLGSGWQIWKDLLSTCDRHSIPLEDIVVRLKLNLLD